MPLLNKKPLVKKKPPADLQPDEEVFFCEPTKEVFRDYDEFFERMILCNSLLWSCEMTGKSGLTYQEAEESERTARKSLNSLSKELKQVLLFLCMLTKKTNLNELCVDIFTYIKERFFIGEKVQMKRGSGWVNGVVRSISIDQGKTSPLANGHAESDKKTSRLQSEGVSVDRVIYLVHELEKNRSYAVRHSELRRDKNAFTRDRLRMFLKHCTRPDERGFLAVRGPPARGLGVEQLKFSDVFVGAPPVFVANKPAPAKPRTPEKPVKSEKNEKPVKSEKAEKPSKPRPAEVKSEPRPIKPKSQPVFDEKDEEPLSSVQLEIRQRWEAERKRMAELKIQERERRRERKKLIAEWLKDWSRPREDLICEDHKELPVMVPVHCRVPNHLVGGCLLLLEFVHSFPSVLDLSDTFPSGLTLPLLERALVDSEMAGPLNDLLQMLLRTIFSLQQDENEEAGVTSAGSGPDNDPLFTSGMDQLDTLTITEILRRHLSTSDSADGSSSQWRYQQRGGYTGSDNPIVQFRLDHPDIMQRLSEDTVFQLSPGERLAVLECLVGEILTTVAVRDLVEEAETKLKEVRTQLRALRINSLAYQKSVAAEKINERREDRQRQMDAIRASSGPAPQDGPPRLEPQVSLPDPQQVAAERERRRREEERQMADFSRRETKLLDQISELSQQFCVQPLGRDRAHRRYWQLRAVPGLFVEHEDETVGGCLSAATPHSVYLSEAEDQPTALRQLLAERIHRQLGTVRQPPSPTPTLLRHTSPSDKENNPQQQEAKTYSKLAAPPPAAAATATEENVAGKVVPDAWVKAELEELVVRDFDLDRALREVGRGEDSGDVTTDSAVNRRLVLCTAEGDTCPVHSSILPRVTWSYCPDLSHLDQLLRALNQRGYRELELHTALLQAGDGLRRAVERCPRTDLTQSADRRPRRDPTSGGQDPNFNFPPGTAVAEIEELILRDLILEMEEKIRYGGLGTVQVYDLEAWRMAIVERSYDQQCDKLTWGADGIYSVDNSEDVSRCSTPTGGAAAPSADGATALSHRLQRRHLVRSLASAVLQLQQGIDHKYLKKPLGASEPVLQRWQSSLMSASSLSQLFLHMAQLESSVEWSRSALNARCKLCRKKSDADKMLLCDGCNKGFHMFCLTPKMKSVPRGDWFCSACRPKEKPKSPKKVRRTFSEQQSDDEGGEQDEEKAEHQEQGQEDEEQEEEEVETPPKRTSRGAKRGGGGQKSSGKKPASTAACSAKRQQRELTPPGAGTSKKRRAGVEGRSSDDQLDSSLLNQLLADLKKHPSSSYFLRPVRAKDAPGYYKIVREPMDLGTMQQKLNSVAYKTNAEFVADAALVFSNCAMYNDNSADAYKQGEKLRRYFEKRLQEVGLSFSRPTKRQRRSV